VEVEAPVVVAAAEEGIPTLVASDLVPPNYSTIGFSHPRLLLVNTHNTSFTIMRPDIPTGTITTLAFME